MIRARLVDPKGENPTVGLLVIDQENVDRLVAGEPIGIETEDMGLPAGSPFVLMYSEPLSDFTFDALARGAITPETTIRLQDKPEDGGG